MAHHLDPGHQLADLQIESRAQPRPRRGAEGAPPRGPLRPAAARLGPARRAGKAAGPRAAETAARPRLAVPRAVGARRRRGLRRRGAAGPGDHRGRRDQRPRGADQRRRQLAQRRLLVPAVGEEDGPRARHRAREPAAGRPPDGLRRRLPAAAGRNLRAGREHLPQPVPAERRRDPAARRGAGTLHGGRRLPADALRRVDHGPRHRLRLPRRPAPGQSGDR